MRYRIPLLLFLLACALTPVLLSGCAGSSATPLQNSRNCDLQGVDTVLVDYATDNITFLESSSSQLTVKEYISSSDSRYLGTVSQAGTALPITGGQRPASGTSFSSHVEIYLPVSYEGTLSVHTSTGSVTLSPTYHLTALQIQTTTGGVSLGTIYAGGISLNTTSGRISLDKGSGSLVATSDTGTILVKEFMGASTLKSSSGSLSITFDALVGDIAVESTTGKISISLPKNNDFLFHTRATSSSVKTDFDSLMKDNTASATTPVANISPTPTPSPKASTSVSPTTGRIDLSATVGTYPVHTISVVSISGAISVKYSS